MSTEPLKTLNQKIQQYLRQSGMKFQKEKGDRYTVRKGSTEVIVSGDLLKSGQTAVLLTAPIARECQNLGGEVGQFLAEENYRLLFGRFAIDQAGRRVVCQHTLLGDNLDPAELIAALLQVVIVADDYDEQIAAMTGGKRRVD